MVDFTLTPNKSLIKPNRGTYVDSWDVPVNSDWDYIDRALGGTFTAAGSSGDINLSVDDARFQQIKVPNSTAVRVLRFPLITGSSTTAVGGMWIVDNTENQNGIVVTTAAPGSSQLSIPANKKQLVFSNGSGAFFADDIRVTAGAGLTLSGTTLSITSPIASTLGGTGFAGGFTNGQLLIGKADGTLGRATLTAGTNITITNGDGTISIASTASGGGTSGISSLTFSSLLSGITWSQPNLSSTNTSTTLQGTLGVANGGTGGTTFTAGFLKANGINAFTTSASVDLGTETTGTLPAARGGTGTTTSTGTGSNVLSASPSLTGTTNVANLTASGTVTISTGASITSGAYNFASSTSISGQSNAIQMNVSGQTVVEMSSTFFQVNKTPYANQTNFSLISDARTKKNVQPYTKSLNDVISLNPVTFQYNGQYGSSNDGVTRSGLLAQDVLTSNMPEMVGTYVYTDPKTGQKTDLYNLNPSELMFAFINSIKALEERIRALEAKVGP